VSWNAKNAGTIRGSSISKLCGWLPLESRAILGWAMSQTLGGQLTTDALAMANSRRGVPELVHSDRGSTYATYASQLDYLEVFYNRQRRHSTISYVAPLAFEESTNA